VIFNKPSGYLHYTQAGTKPTDDGHI